MSNDTQSDIAENIKPNRAADDSSVTPVQPNPSVAGGFRGLIVNFGIPILLLTAAVAIGAVLIQSPPGLSKSQIEVLAPVVSTAELVPQKVAVYVHAYGSVVPARELQVTPEVSGRILARHEHLEMGGLIAAGDLLFRIDPVDYEIAIAQSEADLDVARHSESQIRSRIESLRQRGKQLDIEIDYLRWNADRLGTLAEQASAGSAEARDAATQYASQVAARRTLDAEIAEQERAAESAGASIRVLERRLDVAKLDLTRTEVRAPFDALVTTENVEVGQLVGPQNPIATLVATDEFWAEAAIPVSRLRDVRFATESDASASRVTIVQATAGPSTSREGIALRALGDVDPLGRMATVLIAIRDPLGLHHNDGYQQERILLGSYVRLQIESGTLDDVYIIPRKALRENDRVWVRDADGQLAIRPVKIVWRRHDDVLLRNGFVDGDELVTSHLASVVPGMPLRVRDASEESM